MAETKKTKAGQKKTNTVTTATENTFVESVTGEVIPTPFSEADEKNYQSLCAELSLDVTQIEDRHIAVAGKLAVIYEKKLYKVGNYGNIYDFGKEKFGLSRGYCCNHINIAKKFCQYDEQSGTYTGLLPEYKDFSMCQLIILLSMPKELHSKVSPDMELPDIKRLKKTYMNPEQLPDGTEANTETKNKKTEKKTELLRADNVSALSDMSRELLEQKIMEFEAENPDVPYTLSISVVYDSEK